MLLLPFLLLPVRKLRWLNRRFWQASTLLEQTSALQAQQLLGDQLFLLALATGLLFVPVTALNAWHQPPELGKPRADSVPFP